MNEPTIQTLAERAAELERIAIARCLCRRNRWPSPAEVQRELTAVTMDLAAGRPAAPVVSASTAKLFLTRLGVTVPPVDAPPKD